MRDLNVPSSCRELAWLVVAVLLALSLARLQAEDPAAERAFAGAAKLFQGGWYDQAEKELQAFLAAFPNSTNRGPAVLLQAQSRFQLKNYAGVVSLLEGRLTNAGPDLDQHLFWLAQAQVQLGRFEAAATRYAQLLKDCPASPLRLEASYGEALARYRLGDTARTVELLQGQNSSFLEAARKNTNELVLLEGSFLLAEALYAQKVFPAAEQTLTELAQRGLRPEAEWQRQYLLARIEMSDRRGPAALVRVTNLLGLAASRSNALLQAKSLTLKGELLEESAPETAAQAYESIVQIPGVSAEQKRQALLKLVDLAVSQNRVTNAIQRLSLFLSQSTNDPAADLFRFTLGELHLKQYYALPADANGVPQGAALPAATNLLHLARSQFDQIIGQMTNSPLVGKAHLNRGWCYWEESQLRDAAPLLLECQQSLRQAITRLPKSLEQAQARFKLAECHLRLKDFTNAVQQYGVLLEQFADFPDAKEKLFDHALCQVIRCHIALGNLAGAKAALDQLLRDFPTGSWSERGLFLCGQAWMEAGEFAQAQEAFADFQRRFQTSNLLPEVRLAVARGLSRQLDWAAAIARYSEWLDQFTNHVARPQVEFDRAWCHYQAGSETNAFQLFTNLVQRYPGSDAAPLTHYWLGDYYLNKADYPSAEKHYQYLATSTNSAPSSLTKQAVLMAAKAAFFRQGYPDAQKYLTQLLDDPHVAPEALFMLGDIELEDRSGTNKFAKFEQAIVRFQRVTNLYAGSRLAPLAMGKIADCHFQLAAQDTNRYEMATNQYWQLVHHPKADISTRSQAEVGLGEVLVKMADQWPQPADLLNSALLHHLNVVYGRNLRDGEEADPFWVSKAAQAAGALAVERLQRFDEAERLYRDMLKALPSLAAFWEKRLESLALQRRR